MFLKLYAKFCSLESKYNIKEEHPSGISIGITDGTLEGNSGIVSGIPVPIHISANPETEDSDVMIVGTTPAPE